ncbi:MAG: hypothetical protein HGA25_04930, partial [Clostridiales bacterium]|nr:hypothetical protein [Clostridiales bacterium]
MTEKLVAMRSQKIPVFKGKESNATEMSQFTSMLEVNFEEMICRKLGNVMNGWSMMLKLIFWLSKETWMSLMPRLSLSTCTVPWIARSEMVMETFTGPSSEMALMYP